MSEQAAKALEQVLALTEADQRAVRRALRDRQRQELRDEEARIIQERSDSVHNGTAILLDGDQMEAELFARLRARGSL